MRDFKGMKRQRGRNRGGGGGGTGGGKPQQNANRAFDSNGPDNIKVRGHAQHVFEKYQQLARDAASSGDRVLAENFLQHAEHYFRVLRTLQPNRPVADFIARDTFASGYDIDFEDETGAEAGADESADAAEGSAEGEANGARETRWENRERGDRPRDERDRAERPRDDRQRDDRQRDDRQRDDRQRDDRPRDERGERRFDRDNRDRDRDNRDRDSRDRDSRDRDSRDRQNGDRQNGDRQNGDRQNGDRSYRDRYRAEGDEGYRDRGPREDRYRDDRRERAYEPRGDRDPLAVVEPQAEPLTIASTAPIAQPNLGLPAAPEPTSMLRSSDGETSHAPAFLQALPSGAAAADEAPAKRPRGRPRKRPVEDAAPQSEDA